jgi:SagB-type dehydrogenase family enzyme
LTAESAPDSPIEPVERVGAGDDPTVDRYVVSEYTIVSWQSARVEITSAVSGVKFATDDFDVVRVIHAFAEPRTIEEVTREFSAHTRQDMTTCIEELIAAGCLTLQSAPGSAAQQHWDRPALVFHWSTRQVGFARTASPGAVAIAPRRSTKTIPLIRGSAGGRRDLTDVLDSRRSWRAWPADLISREIFSRFLWLSARNRALSPEATRQRHVSRPYPSGGAAYSLELYPVLAPEAVESIAAGVYRYLPECHGLELVSEARADYHQFLEAAGRSAGSPPPPIVFVITSRFARQYATYGELAYALVLKEVGCVFQTFYLVGEYLGLAPCALGGGAPVGLLARLCDTNELVEPVVGEFMIGPR